MEFDNNPTGSLYTTTQAAERTASAINKTPQPENAPDTRPASEKFASAISAAFSPLLMPSYCAMIAFWATRLSAAPEGARLTSAIVILLLTCFLPLAALLGAVRLGKVSDPRVRDRRQRIYLYPVAIVSYILCAWYLARVHAPSWLSGFFMGVALSCICAFIINFKWKISAHAAACGGMLAFILYIAITGLSDLFFLPWITGAVLITGAVGSSRLILKAHTIGQIIAGIAVAGLCVTAMMVVFG